jgi:4-hydroxybenzoyl-CoA thioesterase
MRHRQLTPAAAPVEAGTRPRAIFARECKIRFSDCDPAGIVFYPQYFVLFNDLMEDWIDALGIGFQRLVIERRIGLPSVRLEADFRHVSRMGDAVMLSLAVERVGGRSLTLHLHCDGADGTSRMNLRQVVVATSLDIHRAIDIPADLRAAIARACATGTS